MESQREMGMFGDVSHWIVCKMSIFFCCRDDREISFGEKVSFVAFYCKCYTYTVSRISERDWSMIVGLAYSEALVPTRRLGANCFVMYCEVLHMHLAVQHPCK